MVVAKEKGTLLCSSCTKVECRRDYPEGVPSWCAANRFHCEIERTKKDYSLPDNLDIYLASGRVIKKANKNWNRIREAIEFAKEMKVSRVGLASCSALNNELRIVAKLFTGAGFEVVPSACKIGGVSPKERGINTSDIRGLACNPIAQAEICNSANTELNYLIGLCLGHDILFTRHAKAPSSVLIVKDIVTGHNPAVALYAEHPRQDLIDLYCKL